MPFLSVSPVNFRNLENKTIDILAKEVFFTGENGQGKSNLLESLYYCAYASSFRSHSDSEIVKNGEKSMSIRSLFREESGTSHTTSIVFDKGTKKIEKDGKTVKDRKELINTIPCVLYNHDDLDFAVGSPERRRFFVDQSLTMYDVLYVDVIRRYRRVLKNRNICLKEHNKNLLSTYDFQLASCGLEIQKKRKNALFKFNQIFGKIYEEVTGISGISIKYNPSWKKNTLSSAESGQFADANLPSVEEIISFLKSKQETDLILGTTMYGPHRDKISFVKNGIDFIPTASTGQRRLIAILLRTSQAVFYTQVTQKKPVLLMDDVLLELDPDKRQKVTALLPEYDQLFCTFLPGEPYQNYKKQTTRVFNIQNGKWEEKI